ncbi:hypothetical protein [Limisalsivibrio acetivorans]|uniref:hypothetical protein n=1 Tax=Limisalsivibrio acetivorans TaxID=1304888 RepID=UPI0003B53F4F|nr:hypothetical protein [Limisalsivibrio acetivorans]
MSKRWKRAIIALTLGFILAAAGIYNTMQDKSWDYYREAKKLYEEERYYEAHETVKQALDENQYNRRALILKGDLYAIITGLENLKNAKKLYQQGMNQAMQGEYDKAKLSLSRAYDLADNVPSDSVSYEEALELMKKIASESETVLNKAPEQQFKRAQRLFEQGYSERAFEALNTLPEQTERSMRLRSEIAYRIGSERYNELLERQKPSDVELNDALYWLEQVRPGDPNYQESLRKKGRLREMLSE